MPDELSSPINFGFNERVPINEKRASGIDLNLEFDFKTPSLAMRHSSSSFLENA
jgi:hypothetical protein